VNQTGNKEEFKKVARIDKENSKELSFQKDKKKMKTAKKVRRKTTKN